MNPARRCSTLQDCGSPSPHSVRNHRNIRPDALRVTHTPDREGQAKTGSGWSKEEGRPKTAPATRRVTNMSLLPRVLACVGGWLALGAAVALPGAALAQTDYSR